ncbi:hypothetical protein NKH01_09305 [Mesorhizobium sp. M1403]
MLPRDVAGERVMDNSEADKAAVVAVIRAETEAWLQRDFEALASHWVQSPQTRRMEAFASLGVRVDEGWDVIAARLKKIVERFPDKHAFEERVRWEKVNIVVDGNVAWMTFDQIGSDTGEDRKRQLRILHRIGGDWKIGCMVMMESSVEEANSPLIEVDADARILWTNRLARERIAGHPGLGKGKPVSTTYLELWCRSNDEGFVTLSKQVETAYASGFSGERAVSTWKERVRKLEELQFLMTKPGVSGSLHYVQLWNPYLIVKFHKAQSTPGFRPELYNVLFERVQDIGARDLD